MSSTTSGNLVWQWPKVGASPISEGLDTEIFDTVEVPHVETFVREAIQNSLDAKLDYTKPVEIVFRVHTDVLGPRGQFLAELRALRAEARLKWPADWDSDQIRWLTIEDFNTKGLSGDLNKRTSDFWNYWLNFGKSNKDGTGRGGRGIGRVTFLVASGIQTVIGLTRRSADAQTAICGMAVLRAVERGDDFFSTHAYLAKAEKKSIYELYDADALATSFAGAFCLRGYSDKGESGFGLVIPYSHPELDARKILAAAIEHFAPAILNGSLNVVADDISLNSATIEQITTDIQQLLHNQALRDRPSEYLRLVRDAQSTPDFKITLSEPKPNLGALQSEILSRIQAFYKKNGAVRLRIEFQIFRHGQFKNTYVDCAVSKTPDQLKPIDRFYRDGMSLPLVKSNYPGDADSIILAVDTELTRYLNFCEGKAHLDLIETKETKQKLEENGFAGIVTVKRFISNLPNDLRQIIIPETNEIDNSVYDKYFSVSAKGTKEPKPVPPKPPRPIPPANVAPVTVSTLKNGFEVKANPKFEDWPIGVNIRIAYADGSRKPQWTEYDFRISDLKVEAQGCSWSHTENKKKKEFRIHLKECTKDLHIAVVGFDTNLELDTRLGFTKHAAAD